MPPQVHDAVALDVGVTAIRLALLLGMCCMRYQVPRIGGSNLACHMCVGGVVWSRFPCEQCVPVIPHDHGPLS